GAGPRGRRADRHAEGEADRDRRPVRRPHHRRLRRGPYAMTDLLGGVARGLGTGSVYALLALGFVIIYKATRVISFAQPALMLAGVVLVTYLHESVGFY